MAYFWSACQIDAIYGRWLHNFPEIPRLAKRDDEPRALAMQFKRFRCGVAGPHCFGDAFADLRRTAFSIYHYRALGLRFADWILNIFFLRRFFWAKLLCSPDIHVGHIAWLVAAEWAKHDADFRARRWALQLAPYSIICRDRIWLPMGRKILDMKCAMPITPLVPPTTRNYSCWCQPVLFRIMPLMALISLSRSWYRAKFPLMLFASLLRFASHFFFII